MGKYTFWNYLKENHIYPFIGIWVVFIGFVIYWIIQGAGFGEIMLGVGIFSFVTIAYLIGSYINYRDVIK